MLGSFAQVQRQQLQASLQRSLPCKHLFSFPVPKRHLFTVVPVPASIPPPSSTTTSEPQKTTTHTSDQPPLQNTPRKGNWKKDAEEKKRNNDDKGTIVDDLTKYKRDRGELLSYIQSVPRLNTLLKHLRDPNQVRDLAVKLAGSSAPHRAMRTIDIASTLGTNLKQNTYEGVAHQYAQKREWFLILSLVAMGLKWTGRTTTRLLNWRIRALVETSRFGFLDGVLEQFRGAELKPNARTFQLLITGHIRNNDLSRARSCIVLMEEYGFELDGSTHALIASSYRQLGPDKDVQRAVLESLRDLGEKQATTALNSLIQLSLDAQDTSAALHYLSLFDHPQGVIAKKTLHHQPPQDLPSLSRSFCPDSATFTMLIKHVTKENGPDLLEKISSLIEKVMVLKVIPDSAVVAAVVCALCTAGDVRSALEIVSQVCRPTTKFEAFVDRMLVLGPVPKTLHLDRDHVAFIARRAELNVHLFNAVINGVSGWLGVNAVRVILRLMHTNKVKPDGATVVAIVSWLNKVERSHPRALIRSLKKLLSPMHRPNPYLCHAVVASLIRKERSWVKNDSATALPPPPNSRTNFSTSQLVPVLTDEEVPQKLGYRGMTRFLVQSLFARQVQSDRITFAQRMKRTAMRGDVSATKSYLRIMLKRGMHPTAYHYAALMEAHTNAGMMNQAETILRSAIQAGIKPNVKLFTILIAGYGKHRRPIPARRAFEEMVRRGIEPDLAAIHAVASAYYKSGLLGLARAFLVEKWKCVALVPFDRRMETVPFVELAREHRRLHERTPVWLTRRIRNGKGNKARRMVFRWKMKRFFDAWRRAASPRERLRKRLRRG